MHKKYFNVYHENVVWKENATPLTPPTPVYKVVLGLAEMELIFTIAALLALCIGSKKGGDNAPVYWLLLRRARTASGLSPQHPPSPVGWGWVRAREGTQPGQLTQTGQGDIP